MQPAAAHSVPGLHPVHECASRLQPESTYLEHLDQLPTACDTTLRSSLPTSAVEAAERQGRWPFCVLGGTEGDQREMRMDAFSAKFGR